MSYQEANVDVNEDGEQPVKIGEPEYRGGYAVNARGEVILTDSKSDVSRKASEERSS